MNAATSDRAAPANIAIEVSRLLEDVRRTFNCDLNAAKKSATSLAALLSNKFPSAVDRGAARGGLAPWQKLKVENYIESELEETIHIADLAKLVSLSTSHFCRAFKDSFGERPHAYVIKRRIARATTLMLTTSESLSQIAIACGLADQSHLCRWFRQITAMTPGAWRRRHAATLQSPHPIATPNEIAFGARARGIPGDIVLSP